MAVPAQGMLGSTLLTAALHDESLKPPSVTTTGCQSIDNTVLAGGFAYGEVTSIAGAEATGKTLVTSALVGWKSKLKQGVDSSARRCWTSSPS